MVNQDSLHFYWGCPEVNKLSDPAIARTSGLRATALRLEPEQFGSCYWLRGITPSKWTQPPEPENVTSWNINARDPWSSFKNRGNIYLDGSGGKQSSDPRTRRCGYAWIQQVDHPADEWDAVGMCYTLIGPQTVPRSELMALITILHFIWAWDGEPGELDIHTDSKVVFDGVRHQKRNGVLSELWYELWNRWETLIDLGWILRVKKVKPTLPSMM